MSFIKERNRFFAWICHCEIIYVAYCTVLKKEHIGSLYINFHYAIQAATVLDFSGRIMAKRKRSAIAEPEQDEALFFLVATPM